MLLKLTNARYAALAFHGLSARLHTAGHKRLALVVCNISRWLTTVEIRPSAMIGDNVRIPHPNGIVIGDLVCIESDVTILQQVTIGAAYIKAEYTTSDVPRICSRSTLGAGSKILGGITVGTGAVIGANAVVLCNVPAGHTAVGIPARVIPPKHGTE
jgi:serine O-acetyltransferase